MGSSFKSLFLFIFLISGNLFAIKYGFPLNKNEVELGLEGGYAFIDESLDRKGDSQPYYVFGFLEGSLSVLAYAPSIRYGLTDGIDLQLLLNYGYMTIRYKDWQFDPNTYTQVVNETEELKFQGWGQPRLSLSYLINEKSFLRLTSVLPFGSEEIIGTNPSTLIFLSFIHENKITNYAHLIAGTSLTLFESHSDYNQFFHTLIIDLGPQFIFNEKAKCYTFLHHGFNGKGFAPGFDGSSYPSSNFTSIQPGLVLKPKEQLLFDLSYEYIFRGARTTKSHQAQIKATYLF